FVVMWTATDTSGNFAIDFQLITVHDTQAPHITCPADITVTVNSNSCVATGVTLGNPTNSDNCAVVSVTNNAPAQFPIGTNDVTWTAADAAGNTATCVQRVIVQSTNAPFISTNAAVILTNSPGLCIVTNVNALLTAPTATNRCGTIGVTNNTGGT